MQNTVRGPKITVSADGTGLVSQAGVLLLAETLRVTGLGEGLSAGFRNGRYPVSPASRPRGNERPGGQLR